MVIRLGWEPIGVPRRTAFPEGLRTKTNENGLPENHEEAARIVRTSVSARQPNNTLSKPFSQ
jgi:hypothetical protein